MLTPTLTLQSTSLPQSAGQVEQGQGRNERAKISAAAQFQYLTKAIRQVETATSCSSASLTVINLQSRLHLFMF